VKLPIKTLFAQLRAEGLKTVIPAEANNTPLIFAASDELTLGAEIEIQLIDPATGNLAPRAEEILKRMPDRSRVQPEVYQSMLEVVTGICADVHEVNKDLAQTMAQLKALGKELEIDFASTGTHPTAKYNDCILSDMPRYSELIDRNQWLTRRWSVYGLHIHIGMKSGDDCIRYNNFLLRFLPHLLALSASSPYWQGEDTGLASCRPTIFESLPTSGTPYLVKNWAEFDTLVNTLLKSRAITSYKDLWWDIRPSPRYGTLELRVCDGVATFQETIAIIAFVHLLCLWFRDHGDWIDTVPYPHRWMLRENKWRALRHGMEADIVISEDGTIKSLKQDVEEWIQKVASYAHEYHYEEYIGYLRKMIQYGNSTYRQRSTASSNPEDWQWEVIRLNIQEFTKGLPLYTKSESVINKAS
jgi:carboxylate-amine ligase